MLGPLSNSAPRLAGIGLIAASGGLLVAFDMATDSLGLMDMLGSHHQQWLVLSNLDKPWLYSAARSASSQAQEAQRELWGEATQHDTEGDAFRHAYASALLTLDMMENHGMSHQGASQLTADAGDTHEADGLGNSEYAKAMDTANNRTGAALIGDGRNDDGEWMSADEVRATVLQAIRGGDLVHVKDEEIVPTTGDDTPKDAAW